MSDQLDQQIVKTKQFSVKPMSAEEAALQLELVGHDFFVFRNDESGEVNVLYRRQARTARRASRDELRDRARP